MDDKYLSEIGPLSLLLPVVFSLLYLSHRPFVLIRLPLSIHCLPSQFGVTMDALNKAQLDGVLPGLRGVAGVASRMDIDMRLHSLPDTFNLFSLALIDLMGDTDSSKMMGYYQIAGQFRLKDECAKQC